MNIFKQLALTSLLSIVVYPQLEATDNIPKKIETIKIYKNNAHQELKDKENHIDKVALLQQIIASNFKSDKKQINQ